jgi:hypothetical protein
VAVSDQLSVLVQESILCYSDCIMATSLLFVGLVDSGRSFDEKCR